MYRKSIVMLFTSICVLLALAAPIMAQDTNPTPANPPAAATPQAQATQAPLTATTDVFVTSPFRVNVRSGPGTEFTILGKLRPSDSADITGQNADNNWLRINFNGQEGWVFMDIVDVTGALDNTPMVEAGPTAVLRDSNVQPTNTTASGDVLIVTRFNTNLRSDSSISADVLDIIPFNTELRPEARTANNNWVMVRFGDQSGWVFAPLLFFANGEIAALPAAEPASNP